MLPFKISILAPANVPRRELGTRWTMNIDFSIFQKTAGVTRFLNQLHVFFWGPMVEMRRGNNLAAFFYIYTIEVGLTITSINKGCKDHTVAPPDLKGIYSVNG